MFGVYMQLGTASHTAGVSSLRSLSVHQENTKAVGDFYPRDTS